jgi:hypothetical protein
MSSFIGSDLAVNLGFKFKKYLWAHVGQLVFWVLEKKFGLKDHRTASWLPLAE